LVETHYAVPLPALRAALPLRMVTPIPLSAPHVIGILRFQGELISALSMGSLLSANGWRRDPAVLLVVDAGTGRTVALDCEEIPKALMLPAVHVDQARQRGGSTHEIITPDQRVVLLIDLPRLLAGAIEGQS
jgi:chemotaxis signal transduction protein